MLRWNECKSLLIIYHNNINMLHMDAIKNDVTIEIDNTVYTGLC